MTVAFVTGGSTGIGAAVVRRFNRCGIRTGFMDINAQDGSQLASELGDNVLFCQGDVLSAENIRQAVMATTDRFHKLDIVFAHAGIHRFTPLSGIADKDIDDLLDVNLKGIIYTLGRQFHSCWKTAVAVLSTCSDQHFIGKANSLVYGASKAAITQMAKRLAIDLGQHNIRVNAVCPGTIKTPMAERAFSLCAQQSGQDSSELWSQEASQYPLQRTGTADEVAELVTFLTSEKVRFMTGGVISVDGGLTAGKL